MIKEVMKDVRAILSIFWSAVSSALLFYIVVKFGYKVEILTLVIGLIGGTIIGGIFGYYYSASAAPKNLPGTPTTTATITAPDGSSVEAKTE